MFGKASLLVVLGAATIFLAAGYRYGLLSTNAVENNIEYYNETVAHNIAVSGANMAANQVFMDKTWTSGYNNVAYSYGTLDVDVEKYDVNKIKITSTGTYNNITKSVKILLQPSSFAKFAYYMNIFPGNTFFYTGDTITGPFHTQGKLNVRGRPIFKGKASAKNGVKLIDNNPPTNPGFFGGFESGVDIPLNWDASSVKTAAQNSGHVFVSNSGHKIDVKMTFNANATMTYSISVNGGTWSTDTTVLLSTFAPNGVIFVDKGNIFLKGVVDGKYTIVADQSSGTSTGNVYIDDDIVYESNPLTNPNTDDMLGIVCSNNVLISDNAQNRSSVNIDASLFSYKGGLGLVNENMPYSGTLKVLGGVIEYQARITGKIGGGGSIVNGYHEKVVFDERLMLDSSPYFPTTGKYEIISWLE